MVITRFAPSPTGVLHIGNTRTALFNYLFAKHSKGKFLLRIEDTDRQRFSEEAVQVIIDGLKWLEINWDDDIVYQSHNIKHHQEIAHQLLKEGKAYKCFSTQEEINEQREKALSKKESFLFKSPWRDTPNSSYTTDKPFVIRLKVPHQKSSIVIKDIVQGHVSVPYDHIDDMVLLRQDGTPTYMLSVVVDDHDMGITHIIRGDDHLTNAARQYMIYQLLGWQMPTTAHIPLIHGSDGGKLSKRHGATNTLDYRSMGYLPEALANYLMRLGWSHGNDEIISMEQAIKWFNIKDVNKAPAKIDYDKLKNLNAHYIKSYDNEKLSNIVINQLSQNISDKEKNLIQQGVNSLKTRAKLITDLVEQSRVYLLQIPEITDEAKITLKSADKKIILDAINLLKNTDDFTVENLKAIFKEFTQGMKMSDVMMPLRILLTGTTSSPSVFEIMSILGKQNSLERLLRYENM